MSGQNTQPAMPDDDDEEEKSSSGKITVGNVRTDRVLRRVVSNFTVAEGLSEIVKNGNDQYEIMHLERQDSGRIIVVLLVQGAKYDSLLVLDLGGGMTPNELAEKWAEWGGDHQGEEGEGEQGIGGKAGMQRWADKLAEFTTFKNGRMAKAVFEKENGEWPELPSMGGYINDEGVPVFDYQTYDSPKEALTEALANYGFDLDSKWTHYSLDENFDEDLPRQMLIETLERPDRGCFSLVAMVDIGHQIPKGGATKAQRRRHNEAVADLITKIEAEAQMRRSLDDSFVFFVHQVGPTYNTVTLLEGAIPEALDGVEPLEKTFQGPFVDPVTGKEFEPEGECILHLEASNIILTGKKWNSLRGILVDDGRNSVWREAVPPGNDAGAAQRIYGRFTVPSSDLGNVATVNRDTVPDVPFARAIMDTMRPSLEEFRQSVAASIRSSRSSSRDTNKEQQALDEKMAKLEDLIDLTALFEDELEGGRGRPKGRSAQILDRIDIENSGESLTEAFIPKGSEFKLRFRGLGIVPGTELNPVTGGLEQLKGVKNLEPYFDMTSSNEEVLEIKEGFVIHALEQGTSTVTISSTDLVHGDASAELELTVVELKTLEIGFDPVPGPRGLTSDLIIQAKGVEGVEFTHNNGLFEIHIEGPASLQSRFPPRIKTGKSEPADGRVIVAYDGGRNEAPFSTTEEIHTPNSRGDEEGRENRNKKFPEVRLCGHHHNIPKHKIDALPVSMPDTINPDPGGTTVLFEPAWDQLGIVWVNMESPESRAKLRNPSTGQSYGQDSKEWNKYITEVSVEVGIQTIMGELIRSGEYFIQADDPTSVHELRREAERHVVKAYEAIEEGTF